MNKESVTFMTILNGLIHVEYPKKTQMKVGRGKVFEVIEKKK